MKISSKNIIITFFILVLVVGSVYVYETIGKHAIRRAQWVTGTDGQVYGNQAIADEAAREEADPFYVRGATQVDKIVKFVVEKKDFSLCSKIEPFPPTMGPLYGDLVYFCQRDSATALGKLGDVSLCKQMDGEYKNLCYIAVASEKKDISICSNVDNAFPYFNTYNHTQKESCYSAVAYSGQNLNYCKNIKGTDPAVVRIYNDCIKDTSQEIVNNTGNVSLCKNTGDVKVCEDKLRYFALSNMCSSYTLSSPEDKREFCNMWQNLHTTDISECENGHSGNMTFSSENAKNDCFASIAINTDNLPLCSRISDTSKKQFCVDALKNPPIIK